MDLNNKRVVLTGAGGGIGTLLSDMLVERGASLCRLVRRPQIDDSSALSNERIVTLTCDITQSQQRNTIMKQLDAMWGGVDVLINLAGVLDFQSTEQQDPEMLHRIILTNVEAPLQLSRLVLPGMLARGQGRIVNVGSMFGSIGFPFFAAYSASKFALRGYSQALRRELAGSGVGVTYVSPRAVNTPLNPPGVHEMAARGMMNMDDAAPIARAIVRAIEKERNEAYLGFPESLFARINALFPSLVDRALSKQTPHLRGFVSGQKIP